MNKEHDASPPRTHGGVRYEVRHIVPQIEEQVEAPEQGVADHVGGDGGSRIHDACRYLGEAVVANWFRKTIEDELGFPARVPLDGERVQLETSSGAE